MRGFARESHLDVWYERLNASELVDRFGGKLGAKGRIVFAKPFAKARRKTSLRAVEKLTERVDGELRFRSVPPLLVPLRELFDPADARDETRLRRRAARRVRRRASTRTGATCSGPTGSSTWPARSSASAASARARGCSCSSAATGKDPLVLQAKEAQASVLEPYLGASEFENHGERVVRGQRISQAASDIFLSWQRSEGLDGQEHDFYVRQLWDWKASDRPRDAAASRACTPTRAPAGGRWPARTPARATGSRSPPTWAPGSNFDEAIARFSAAYADQNELDHERLADAVAAGDVVAESGV